MTTRPTTTPTTRFAALAIGGLLAACTPSSGDGLGGSFTEREATTDAPDAALIELPVPGADTGDPGDPGEDSDATSRFAVINDLGQLTLVDHLGRVDDRWFKFRAVPAPDRSVAVLSLPPEIDSIGPERPLVWADLPAGDQLAQQVMSSDQEVAATSLDGAFVGLTTVVEDAGPDAIAGARTTSRVTIVSRDDGVVYEQELEGNFVPEAFSRSIANGVPALVFLLEYFPAEAPRFYRVRVLSTETGDVSLPLDLRNKQQQVDERMAGFTRSQVVAHEHGLLFTLYRGTIDGTPDGEPYAFVHTLDFADGVWCLEVDPSLELERYPGRLAVGGDRLYVASANGHVGSFPIPSIVDPDLSPSMDWSVELTRPSSTAPVVVADDEGAWIGPADGASRLIRIDTDGVRGDPLGLPGPAPQALARGDDGALHAVGADWSTFELIRRPDWLANVAEIIPG